MRVAVLTLAHRRHEHLRGQVAGLEHGERLPDLHVVAVMDDRELASGLRSAAADTPWQTVVVELAADPRGLPLAAARNLAARTAVGRGAEGLVFLDVDCIPGPGTVATYARHLMAPHTPESPAPEILCGDVAYLPPLPDHRADWTDVGCEELVRLGEHRADRVRLEPGQRQPEPELTRFWSLSFALRAADFERTGGFCPDYVGYGGEDTDFAQVVGARGGSLTWVGGATAYHQHHPSPSPPLQHLEPIVRNASIFFDRWGWWPMGGWLEAFAELGLAERDGTGRWRLVGLPAGADDVDALA